MNSRLDLQAQLERVLQEREQGVRRAHRMARLAHLVVRGDGSFEQDAFGTLHELVGCAPEQLPRNTREWMERVHADDRARFRDQVQRATDSKGAVQVEYRLQRGDGAWADVQQEIVPLDDASVPTSAQRWFNTLQDVTQYRRAERELRESELRFRQVAENIDDILWVASTSLDRFIYLSPAYEKVFRMSCARAYADAAAWQAAVHPDDRRHVRAETLRCRSTGRSFRYEFRILLPDGETRWILNRGFPILDDSGVMQRIAGMATDITEHKAAEARIERLNRMYAVLSGINTLIVRVRDRQSLFDGVCRIAVEVGRFDCAWIAAPGHSSPPLAWAGGARAMQLAALLPQPAAPTHAAPVFCNDAKNELAWPAHAAACGVPGALATLPIRMDGQVLAVLGLAAAEAGAFDADEQRLLHELAGDMSFALDHLQNEERLRYLAYYDAQTGLANSTLFHERLARFIDAAQHAQHKLALLVLDIERFKRINDTFGRGAGDQVLKTLAQRLQQSPLKEGALARVGADRFAIVFEQVRADADIARLLEERLREWLSEPVRVGGTELRIGCKVGIALYPNDGSDAHALFGHAEEALKRAKATGDRYLFHAEQMSTRIAEQLALENKLRLAIERDEFELYYQPKVDVTTRKIASVEALIRWNSPELGLVSPAKFVPLLEETGLILEVGQWALRRAVQDQRAWREQGLCAPRIAVNVSAIQLRQGDFVETVRAALALDASAELDIEITESLVMRDIEANIAKLGELRRLGVQIAIDDFGTGYSSLAYLAKLPVHTMKIDRSFVTAMVGDRDVLTLVSTIVSMAHAMRLNVVAEGVETEEQAELLRTLRCDLFQGFLVSRPVPRAALAQALAKAA